MKIVCSSVEDFLANIDGEELFTSSVHLNTSKHSLNGRNPSDATSWSIVIQLSAVIDYADGGQALVECGEDCGVDRIAQPQSTEGTDQLTRYTNRLREFCKARNLKVKPGLLEL